MVTKEKNDAYIAILREEHVAALGCTEPIAFAYAAAVARKILGRMPEHMEISCSGNIVKNVKGVKPSDHREIGRLLADGLCSVSLVEGVENLYILARVYEGNDSVEVRIERSRMNIVHASRSSSTQRSWDRSGKTFFGRSC